MYFQDIFIFLKLQKYWKKSMMMEERVVHLLFLLD